MTDDVWKKHLAELYKDHSKKQKDKKGISEPFSNVLGAKNVKGVSQIVRDVLVSVFDFVF